MAECVTSVGRPVYMSKPSELYLYTMLHAHAREKGPILIYQIWARFGLGYLAVARLRKAFAGALRAPDFQKRLVRSALQCAPRSDLKKA